MNTIFTCDLCGKTMCIDTADEDDIHNAYLIGWDFSIYFNGNVTCPDCNNLKKYAPPEIKKYFVVI